MPLVVRIDLVPNGFLEGSHEIGRAVITNTGDHPKHPSEGNYDVQLSRALGDRLVTRRGTARDVTRSQDVWHFLFDLLDAADIS